MRYWLLLFLFATVFQAGCATCAPLGSRTLPSGEDKYSAQYD
jgi:hypothetical protein